MLTAAWWGATGIIEWLKESKAWVQKLPEEAGIFACRDFLLPCYIMMIPSTHFSLHLTYKVYWAQHESSAIWSWCMESTVDSSWYLGIGSYSSHGPVSQKLNARDVFWQNGLDRNRGSVSPGEQYDPQLLEFVKFVKCKVC